MAACNLTEKHCAPCEGGVPSLSPAEAERLAGQVPGWKLESDPQRIEREYRFGNFAQAMAMVNRVARLAEVEGHHPDIHIHYNQVRLVLWTHAIKGLSENDFILAAKIDAA